MSPDILKSLIQAQAKEFRKTLEANDGKELKFVIVVADPESERLAFATNTTDDAAMHILEGVLDGTRAYYESFPYRTDVN